ncbi:hypothetical protein F5148DRAFT_1178160, partial [Russula earlei]
MHGLDAALAADLLTAAPLTCVLLDDETLAVDPFTVGSDLPLSCTLLLPILDDSGVSLAQMSCWIHWLWEQVSMAKATWPTHSQT